MTVLFTRMKQAPGASYHYVADRLSKSDIKSAKGLANGAGALIQTDGHKVAVYKDDAGQLHVMSPVCRHLKCIVDWNPAEKTWDCPCHGSRYDAYGKVIHGPAKKDLLPATLE